MDFDNFPYNPYVPSLGTVCIHSAIISYFVVS